MKNHNYNNIITKFATGNPITSSGRSRVHRTCHIQITKK